MPHEHPRGDGARPASRGDATSAAPPSRCVDGETGYLVPPGDPRRVTRAARRSPPTRRAADTMGAAGRRRQRERFTGERMVDGYESAFRRAIAPWPGLTSCSSRSAPRSAGGVADELLLAQLERAGRRRPQVVGVGRGATDRLRRGYPVNDVVEMYAARRAVRTAVERHEPRALIVSSTTAAMLLPSLPMPYAVRFDAPARLNRPGARNAPLRALERRAMRRARLTVPFSVAGAEALPEGAARPVVVSPPIDPSAAELPPSASASRWHTSPTRRRRASTSRGADGRRRRSTERGSRCYGLDPEWARSHLRRSRRRRAGLARPARHGPGRRLPRAPAPGARVRPRRALGGLGPGPARGAGRRRAARHRPGRGPVRGRCGSRAGSTPRSWRAGSTAAALGPAIRAAFELPDEAARAYRERAAELLRPYRSDAVQETVASELLPALLDATRVRPPKFTHPGVDALSRRRSRAVAPPLAAAPPAPTPRRPPPADGAR